MTSGPSQATCAQTSRISSSRVLAKGDERQNGCTVGYGRCWWRRHGFGDRVGAGRAWTRGHPARAIRARPQARRLPRNHPKPEPRVFRPHLCGDAVRGAGPVDAAGPTMRHRTGDPHRNRQPRGSRGPGQDPAGTGRSGHPRRGALRGRGIGALARHQVRGPGAAHARRRPAEPGPGTAQLPAGCAGGRGGHPARRAAGGIPGPRGGRGPAGARIGGRNRDSSRASPCRHGRRMVETSTRGFVDHSRADRHAGTTAAFCARGRGCRVAGLQPRAGARVSRDSRTPTPPSTGCSPRARA